MKDEKLLGRLAKIRVDRSKGVAPHKPLLLLVILELAKQQILTSNELRLTPELAYRFAIYWSIVAHRRTQPPDIRLPFHHLNTSKLWTTHTDNGSASKHRETTTSLKFSDDFFHSLQSNDFRQQAGYLLISNYFEPAEQIALYEMAGLKPPKNSESLNELTRQANAAAKAEGRSARFRVDIVAAYCYTCALTGYRITTITGHSIVDAAHIHRFANSRNDDTQNGIALCKNAHWLFDLGLWSINDDYRVIVADEAFNEDCPAQESLGSMAGKRLILPRDERFWPSATHLSWHRRNCFVGSVRT